MENYIPKYIKKTLDYRSAEKVTADEYNNLFNLLILSSDYNTEVINALINDATTNLVINSKNALRADEADLAHDSEKLSGATLVRSVAGNLASSDGTIPSSKQVKDYVDSVKGTLDTTIGVMNTTIAGIQTKDTQQDGRLSTLDSTVNSNRTRITSLEGRVYSAEAALASVQTVNINQNNSIASLNTRVTAIELETTNPEEALYRVMLKDSYALVTGTNESGNIYSDSIVNLADKANNIVQGTDIVPANAIALKTEVNTLSDNSFINRGNMTNPTGANYSCGELRALKHGAYYITTEQSAALNMMLATAGALRVYPSVNGTSLEFESQASATMGTLYTMFIPTSIADNVTINTLTWEDQSNRLHNLETSVTSLTNTRLIVNNIQNGADINRVENGNTVTLSYAGPKIVIDTVQPSSDPVRTTLWINL